MSPSCRRSSRLAEKATRIQDNINNPSELSDLDSEHEHPVDLVKADDGYQSDGSVNLKDAKEPRRHQRRKITSSGAPTSLVKSGKRRAGSKSLSLLPEMPLDILFEVMSHLSPADLLSIARTARNFRELLMSKRAVSIWKSARERVAGPDAPTCPPDLSEPQWANLLWGGNACQECGTRPMLKVTFALRRRVCKRCLKERLCKQPDYQKKYPGYDDEILDLIPYSNVGGWSRGRETSTKYFWDDDIESVAQKFEMHKKAIRLRTRDAKANMETFKKERAETVRGILANAHELQNWYESVVQDQASNAASIRYQRLHDMRKRLEDDGWESQDVDAILAWRTVPAKPLTELAWKRMYPHMIEELEQIRLQRLELEFRRIVHGRKALLEKAYSVFLRTLVPSEALLYPHTDVICDLPQFQQILNRPREDNVVSADFSAPFEDGSLARFIHDWLSEDPRKKVLLSKISSRGVLLSSSPFAYQLKKKTSDRVDKGTSSEDIDVNSARAVFSCSCFWGCRSHIICGFDEAVLHVHHHNRADVASMNHIGVMEFDHRMSRTIETLLTLLGLPLSATCREIDAQQRWFVCDLCLPRVQFDNKWCKPVLTWRQCLNHFCSMDHRSDDISNGWKLLSREESDALNLTNPQDTVPGWYCNHCSHFISCSMDHKFGSTLPYGTKTQVLEHLQEHHSSSFNEPSTPQDYAWNPVQYSHPSIVTPQAPKKATWDELAPYQCHHCPGSAGGSLFDVLMAHLRNEHHIASPADGTDYHCMN